MNGTLINGYMGCERRRAGTLGRRGSIGFRIASLPSADRYVKKLFNLASTAFNAVEYPEQNRDGALERFCIPLLSHIHIALPVNHHERAGARTLQGSLELPASSFQGSLDAAGCMLGPGSARKPELSMYNEPTLRHGANGITETPTESLRTVCIVYAYTRDAFKGETLGQ